MEELSINDIIVILNLACAMVIDASAKKLEIQVVGLRGTRTLGHALYRK